jgi:hypothetical protein
LDIWSDDTSIEFHWTHKHGGKNLWHIFTTAAQGKFIWSVNCKPQGAISLRYFTLLKCAFNRRGPHPGRRVVRVERLEVQRRLRHQRPWIPHQELHGA